MHIIQTLLRARLAQVNDAVILKVMIKLVLTEPFLAAFVCHAPSAASAVSQATFSGASAPPLQLHA